MGEFDLIERFFLRPGRQPQREGLATVVTLGIGDDCALLQPRPGTQVAVSTDMLVEGHHFFADVDPGALGHKALAVNLSDLAACGAQPLAFTLALALPQVDEAWLAKFSQGLFALADAHGCELMGGDTTAGPLTICITVFGEVPLVGHQGQTKSLALLRSGAQVGDDIYVSGTPGLARLALDILQGKLKGAAFTELLPHIRPRLERPTPRVALGLALRGVASSAIDLSDGLLGDLAHMLKKSTVGAVLDVENATNLISGYVIKITPKDLNAYFLGNNERPGSGLPVLQETWLDAQLNAVLSGGDDYELLFTAAPGNRNAVANASTRSQTPVTRIGQIEAGRSLRLIDKNGHAVANRWASFDHFA